MWHRCICRRSSPAAASSRTDLSSRAPCPLRSLLSSEVWPSRRQMQLRAAADHSGAPSITPIVSANPEDAFTQTSIGSLCTPKTRTGYFWGVGCIEVRGRGFASAGCHTVIPNPDPWLCHPHAYALRARASRSHTCSRQRYRAAAGRRAARRATRSLPRAPAAAAGPRVPARAAPGAPLAGTRKTCRLFITVSTGKCLKRNEIFCSRAARFPRRSEHVKATNSSRRCTLGRQQWRSVCSATTRRTCRPGAAFRPCTRLKAHEGEHPRSGLHFW